MRGFRSFLRTVLAMGVLATLVGLAGGLLAIATHATAGVWNPLPTTWPWHWSPSAIARWLGRDAGAGDVVPVGARVLSVMAWLLLLVLLWTLARELWCQVSARRAEARTEPSRRPHRPVAAPVRRPTARHTVAASLVALLLGAASFAPRVGATLPARAAATTLVVEQAASSIDAPAPVASTNDALPALGPGLVWAPHVVATPNESLRSIAEQVSGDPALARTIWQANQGRQVTADAHFMDPAVVQAGWTLLVPTRAATVAEVRAGDTLWGLVSQAVEDPSPADVTAVAMANDGIATPDGAHVFHASRPGLINPGQQFDLAPALARHGLVQPSDVAESLATEADTPAPEAAQPPDPTSPAPSPPVPTPAPAADAAAEVSPDERVPSRRPLVDAPTPSMQAADLHGGDNQPDSYTRELAGSLVLASGLTLLVRRQRRRRAARGAKASRRVRPQDEAIETALRRAADVPLVRWAGQELAELVARLKPGRLDGAPVAVELSSSGIELLWDVPNPLAPHPWEAADGGWAWRCVYDPDHPVPAAELSSAIPALVTIGQRDGRQLLLDLERFGVLGITGDDEAVDAFVRAVLLELGTGDEIANAWVVAVGVDVSGIEHLDRLRTASPKDTLAWLRTMCSASNDYVSSHAGTFHARCGSSSPLEATVAVVNAAAFGDISELVESCRPRRGVAAIAVGAAPTGAASLDIARDGSAVLRGLGTEPVIVEAAGVGRDASAAVTELLDAESSDWSAEEACRDCESVVVNEDSDPAARCIEGAAVLLAAPVEATCELPARPRLLVRVLGIPAVPDRPELARRRSALSLVVYLASQRRPVPREKIMSAVWGGELRTSKTLNNTAYEARIALGSWPDGVPIIPASDLQTGTMRIHEDVMTDLQWMQRLLGLARCVPDAQALTLLREALALVEGEPFDAPGYEWAEDTQLVSEARIAVEEGASALTDRALAAGDLALARYALVQAAKALPGSECLARLRMTVESRAGDVAAVHRVWRELERQLRDLGCAALPESTELYQRLASRGCS